MIQTFATTLPRVEAEPCLTSGGTGEAAHCVDALLPQFALVQGALINVLDLHSSNAFNGFTNTLTMQLPLGPGSKPVPHSSLMQ